VHSGEMGFGVDLVESCDVASGNRGVNLRTRFSPGRVMVCLAQGACLIRAEVGVWGWFKRV